MRPAACPRSASIGERQILHIALAEFHARDDEFAGFAIRKLTKQDRIGNAENRGARFHAKANGEHCNGREEWIPGQDANSEN
ncbi:hypothetical protein [Occallatibacter riparius]|uniref:Uncharacterized protein n=1 Tax=Occallatibacter riparius TaxID=1002689 RepID=A0A9J7BF87_9BACT|nr:hypothetical protein [Occallatibacter riparius]UWZ81676.1 hypothetical protein MOP44_13895 [Occallatibacter riparius]